MTRKLLSSSSFVAQLEADVLLIVSPSQAVPAKTVDCTQPSVLLLFLLSLTSSFVREWKFYFYLSLNGTALNRKIEAFTPHCRGLLRSCKSFPVARLVRLGACGHSRFPVNLLLAPGRPVFCP